jgi:Spy/CpxP family protein refolding chaperone
VGAVALFAGLGLAAPAAAQQPGAPTPYAGEQHRAIKALSPQEMDGLRRGEGLGYAITAELNGYPGPRHVLELADSLAITPAQRERVRAVYEAMRLEAVALGEVVIAEEAALDRAFADGSIDEGQLAAALERIAGLQARLRGTHLRAHLALRGVLSPGQVAAYARLRGYGGAGTHVH